MRLRTKLLLAFLAIGLLAFLYLLRVGSQEIKPGYLAAIEDHLVDTANMLASLLELEAAASGSLNPQIAAAVMSRTQRRELAVDIYDYRKTNVDLRVYITDPEGILLYDSRQPDQIGADFSGWRDVALTLRGKYGARSTWEEDDTGNRQFVLYVAAPIYQMGQPIGVVTVGKPTPTAYELYNNLRNEALLALTLVAVLSTVALFMITAWVTQPIEQLTTYAQAVRDGRPAQLPALGKGDIGSLGDAFEEMRDSLEGKQYVEQYVQTLTHEIKSPLSAIRGAAELLDESMPAEQRATFLTNIRNESDRIQRLIDRLLDLSAIENRKGLVEPKTLRLRDVVAEAIDALRSVASHAQISLSVTRADDSRVWGERFLLRTALTNLIHNAVDFSPTGATVEISIQDGRVQVADDGPGIPDYARERIFERFYSLRRPASGKKSSGLGLSIAAKIAELHGGQVRIATRPQNGTLATLTLPVQPDA